ncbi:hypothetical protein F2Q69_00034877 [Brassica cretica]|uniref:Uncharacterized protein n=1 Tax=Brassica cretica TaxID=69181 RepID=A0A8S9SB57_BRACR|nr:hypothetical protein F2Q69_00034877 [Brassica cretica]
MAGGFYSSDIDLFDSFCFFCFDLLYFQSFDLFDCKFILNLTKFFIVLLHVSSNGFGKTKSSLELNSLENVIDRSTADGGDGSYRLQSLMVLHLMVKEFLLQTMVILKVNMKFYGTIQCAPICFGTQIRIRRYRRTLVRSRLRSSSCPPDQLQLQGVPDPRRTQLHPTSRTARNPTATAPVRIRAARDPIEAARVPIVSKLEVHSWWSGFYKQLN